MDIPKIVQELPPAPKGVRSWILKSVAQGRYMIYSIKENRVVCTYCGAVHRPSDLAPAPVREAMVVCPHCHEKAIYKCKNVGRKKLTEYTSILVLVKRGRSLYATISEIDISFEDEEPEVYLWLSAAYKFNANEQSYYKRHPEWSYGAERWEKRVKMKAPSTIGGAWYGQPKRDGLYLYDKNLGSVLQGTDLRYADLTGFLKEDNIATEDLIPYLSLSAKYTSVEQLWKAGFRHLVIERVRGYGPANAVYWRGKTLRKILGLTMDHIRTIRDEKLRLSALAIYKRYVKRGAPITAQAAKMIDESERRWDGKTRCQVIETYVPIAKAAAYIAAQKEAFGGSGIDLSDYVDYLGELEKLERNTARMRELFPADFKLAHQATAEAVRKQADTINAKAFAKTQEKIVGRAEPWASNGLMIRPAKDPTELKVEGKGLGHCVAGYADKVARGFCVILLIRKEEEPDTPYYTLELSVKGELVQCRGEKNRSMTEDVEAFVKAFLKELKRWRAKPGQKTATNAA